ncbi:MAG: hypothetical protein P9M00_13480 [Candidatus Tritonobacter lacicola]|nr:hypothetical protein [Candidatus Tritonobacter lacicola]
MKAILSWSSGKECAIVLYKIQQAAAINITGLLTTVTAEYDRVSMHGVRTCLVERQARSAGLPLIKVYIPKDCSHMQYDSIMKDQMLDLLGRGVSRVAFGDIFLEGVRKYRERNLGRAGMKGLFPLWGRDTGELAREFIDLGFKAVVTCVDSSVLDGRFAGRLIDHEFLNELPGTVDPCGENGEFHSFVYDGPNFKERIPFSAGNTVLRNSLYFYDLIPA